MPQPLIRLSYSSRLRTDVTQADVDDIIKTSIFRNTLMGITGMLALDDRRVCQILEGPAAQVAHLYQRIELDDRHEGVVELNRQPIYKRSFPNWGMRRLPMAEAAIVAFSR